MVFVGDGADKDEVISYAGELALNGDCIFTGAVHDREELRGWYSLADILLFPSTFDTNGLVVREAAACGLPSRLIEGSCAAEGISDGRTGILIQNEAEALAEALARLGENFNGLKEIGRAAMDEIYISWEDSVRHAVERYRVVLDNWSGAERRRLRPRPEEVFALSDKLIDELDSMKAKPAFLPERMKFGRRRRQESRLSGGLDMDGA